MPRPSDYTPARRMMMRVVMVLLLAGTLALAGVVGHALRAARQVALDDRAVSGDGISVRLPKHWKLRARGADPRAVAWASEGSSASSRSVEVFCQRLRRPLSPMQYLAQMIGGAFESDLSRDESDSQDAGSPGSPAIAMAGQQGVMIALAARLQDERGASSVTKHVYACAITPGLRAIVVHLQGPDEPQVDDLELVRSIAGSISLDAPPRLEPEGSPIRLEDGVSCTSPSGFAPIDRSDPNRTDYLLWPILGTQGTAEQLERNWATLEVVGCMWPKLDAATSMQRAQAMRAMLTLLAARDPAWHGARVEPVGPDQWRADLAPVAGASTPFPASAFLRTDSSGRALLAIFHGGFDGGAFDAAWKQLADSAHFDPPTMDWQKCEQVGADEVQALRRRGYEQLLAGLDEQWWLMLDSSSHPHIGWQHLDFDLNSLAGTMRSCLRESDGSLRRIDSAWSYHMGSSDFGRYRSDVVRRQTGNITSGASLRQLAEIANGRFILSVQSGPGAGSQFEQPLPAQYVPGQILPLLMGQLPAKPMVLRSESFPLCEASGAPDPLTILIRPESAPNSTGDAPQRCLIAEVNGSGRLSRWYFNSDDEVASVEFSDGRRCVPSDGKTIKFDFADEPGMSP